MKSYHLKRKIEESGVSTPKKLFTDIELGVSKIFMLQEEVESCYVKYGGCNGFDKRRRSMYKSRFEDSNGVVFVCSCEGSYKSNKRSEGDGKAMKKQCRVRSTVKTSCGARIYVRLLETSKGWEVTIFDDDHNHHSVTPTKQILLRSNRILPKSTKIITQRLKEINVIFSIVVPLFGETNKLPFSKRDVWNHMKTINFEPDDGDGVNKYFEKAAAESPYFCYAIECTHAGWASNLLWIDARSRNAYTQFGDAITFDTTYNMNKYKIPFVPFTGVNHHRQSILFGCALLENETEDTFTWLFETWHHTMGGKAPSTIITDQDLAMTSVIGTEWTLVIR